MNTATIRTFSRLGWAVLASAAAVVAVLLLQASPSWAQIVSGPSGASGSTGPAISSGTANSSASSGAGSGANSGSGTTGAALNQTNVVDGGGSGGGGGLSAS